MKCDELKYEHLGDANKTYPASTLIIRKQFVDEAIDELKDELNRVKAREDVLCTDNRDLLEKVKMLEGCLRDNTEHFKRNEMQIIEASDNEIKKLKAENERLNRELEHVKNGDCINTCDVVEKHVKEELKAKRALWMARAEKAKTAKNMFDILWKFASREKVGVTGCAHKINGAKTLKEPKFFFVKFNIAENKCRNKAEEYK